MRFNNYLKERVEGDDVASFVTKWKTKLATYGVTNFEASTHWIRDSLNNKRNNPPITLKELNFILEMFLRKMGSQFKTDVENIKNHIAKKRGLNKQELNNNEYEYVIKSKSTNIALPIVLKQDFKQKGTAAIVPITVQRKKGYKVNKGIEVMVEKKEIYENDYIVIERRVIKNSNGENI